MLLFAISKLILVLWNIKLRIKQVSSLEESVWPNIHQSFLLGFAHEKLSCIELLRHHLVTWNYKLKIKTFSNHFSSSWSNSSTHIVIGQKLFLLLLVSLILNYLLVTWSPKLQNLKFKAPLNEVMDKCSMVPKVESFFSNNDQNQVQASMFQE